MAVPKAARRDVRFQAADVLGALIKTVPLHERLAEGCLIASRAVCGACLAYGIASTLHTHQPFWGAITAIAVTQQSYADTRHLSRDQFVGAMAGGLFGFVGASLGAGTQEIIGYALTVAAVIVICWCLNLGSAARLAAITATIVLLVPMQAPLWDVPLMRLMQVAIGAASTLFVSYVFGAVHRLYARRLSPRRGGG